VAAISIHGQVAVLGGAATLPEARGRGAQALLLRTRLAIAIEVGCTLATATAAAGSTSLRNLARAGFVIHERPAFGISEADRSK
jgi:GNAT superfamily N-acetyltransferase